MPVPAEVRQKVQRLLALRPPTDPATGLMHYDTKQAHEYREALRDIVDRYGSIEEFQEAAGLPDPAGAPGPQPASAAVPGPPGLTAMPPATPPPAPTLARFAADMMAPGPSPATGGVVQNAGLPALMPRRGTGTVL